MNYTILHLNCYVDLFYIEQNKSVEHIHSTFTVHCENGFFASSIVKNIAAPSARSRFPVKLIFCTSLDQHEMIIVYLIYYCHFMIIIKVIII